MSEAAAIPKTRSGIAVGKNHGHSVERRLDVNATRVARHKKVAGGNKKLKEVRKLISEVAGLAPYEKKLLDMVKVFGTAADKKIYQSAKKKLGTHARAMRKREVIKERHMAERARAM